MKWGAVGIVLIFTVWIFIAYWSSTNDCGL